MEVVSFNPISGPNFGGYQSQHLKAVPRQKTESVAPNVLRNLKSFIDLDEEIDEEELLRLLTLDEVELSEEARDILRKVKRRRKRGRDRDQDQTEQEFLELLSQLEDKEPNVGSAPTLEKQNLVKPFLPPVIQLSNYSPLMEAHRPPPKQAAEPDANDISSLTRAGKIGLAMVAIAPSKTSAMKVARDLEVFGNDILTEVKRFGTRIVVVEPRKAFTEIQIGGTMLFGAGEKTFDGRSWSVVRGVYSSKRRIICLGEELLDESQRSGQSTVRHEFAHAYEDVWSKKRQRRQPMSVELWYRFEKSRKSFISSYASTQPAEYFAESVEAYFAPKVRDKLRSGDPEMFAYLGELFPNS